MKKNSFIPGIVFIFTFLLLSAAGAEEESLDLDAEVKVVTPTRSEKPKFAFMGRVDLTSEIANQAPAETNPKNELKNNHFLVFIKAQPSARTSFLAEIVRQSFYTVNLKLTEEMQLYFGKILVPFGDNRYFHHYYGGAQGFGPQGVMFPNIWAESGLGLKLQTSSQSSLEIYMVNAIAAEDSLAEVDLQSSSAQHQAFGLRWTQGLSLNQKPITYFLSGYRGDYFQGRPLTLLGADLEFDYGSLGVSFLKLKLGMAQAIVEQSPGFNSYLKTGDYIATTWTGLGPGELGLRYGTYIDNNKFKSNLDSHNWSLSYALMVDVIRFSLERQWNMEAVNEVDNDVLRLMATLDF